MKPMQILFETDQPNFALLQEILRLFEKYEAKDQPTILRIRIADCFVEVYLDNDKKVLFTYAKVDQSYSFHDFIEEEHALMLTPYTDEAVMKMATELSSKTKLLKKLKKKWRKAYTISRLAQILVSKKTKEIDPSDYQGWDTFDDEGYGRATAKREAEIQLLDDLIASKQKKRWMSY